MGYSVYTVSVSGKQYFGITADFDARPDLDLTDAARDEPLTWIGAQLKSSVPETTKADFSMIETHDTLCAAIASQVQRIAQCRKTMLDPWYDEIPSGYYPADDGSTEMSEEFPRHRGPPFLCPWMSDEAAVRLENDIMWNERDAAKIFYTQGDITDLLVHFYYETMIRRRTVVSSAAAYDTRTRKVIFKTSGTHPNDWDAASPAEFAESAATWICDRAERFALRVLSGRCANPRVDMNAMRTLARDALRIMHENVGKGKTALDVARTRVSHYISKKHPSMRGDLTYTIRTSMTEDIDEMTRVNNVNRIMPRNHPQCVPRKAALPVLTKHPWPPIVVPEDFLKLGKAKREPATAIAA